MNNPLMGFSALMLQANEGMKKAESNREQVVQVLRSAAVADIEKAGAELGDALGRFQSETLAAENELEALVNISEAALSKPEKPGTWNMTAARLNGKLHAEVNEAKRVLMHTKHLDSHDLRAGKEQATQMVEGEASKFDTKLGDMSVEMADVERKLEQHIADASDMVANGTAPSPHLDALQKQLEDAEAAATKKGNAAKKRLRSALAIAGKKLTAEDANLLNHIDANQLQDLSGFFSPLLEKLRQQKPK